MNDVLTSIADKGLIPSKSSISIAGTKLQSAANTSNSFPITIQSNPSTALYALMILN